MPEMLASLTGGGRGGQALARPAAALLVAVGAGIGVILLGSSGAYYGTIGVTIMLSLVLAISVRPLLVGGEASFCHAAFYAVGAYAVAILCTKAHISPWLALPLAGAVAAVAAVIIGAISLRSSGATFFVMTFGFLVLITALFKYATGVTGGLGGISGIPSLVGFGNVETFYWVTAAFAAFSVLFFTAIDRSRWGLELRALGESHKLAEAVGISRENNLLAAFVIGAFFAGVAGGFYGSFISFISPTSFSFWLSIYVLTYVMVGGAASVLGPIVGTAIVGTLPLLSGWSDATAGLFVAVVTLLILMAVPRGVAVTVLDRLPRGRGSRRPEGEPARGAAPAAQEPAAPAAPAAQGPAVPAVAAAGAGGSEGQGQEILMVEQLHQDYGGVPALQDVSVSVADGEILGVIGPNGAGKTTFFNAISGFTRPTDGKVTYVGENVTGLRGTKMVKRGLVRTFQAATVFPELSVLDNVLVGGASTTRRNRVTRAFLPLGRDRQAQASAAELLDRFGLTPWAGQRADDLPYGLRKMLGVAVAMAARPRLLCLDEPLAGLSEDEADQMMDVVAGLRGAGGVTIVVIDHRLRALRPVCDRFLALDAGKVIADGDPGEVLANPEIVSAYVGVAPEPQQ